MAASRNAVFTLRANVDGFNQKIRQAEGAVRRLEGTSQKADIGLSKMDQTLQRSGQTATTAAVNFQTFTTGLLNLTTAGTQVFVSMSNLDRAANRLAMAQVAVARAEDLLANKQIRLNELTSRGLAHTDKAIQLTNELATARADLAVKNDKLVIEEKAITDIQLLFATNVANVLISSLQTIVTMKNLNIIANTKELFSLKVLGPIRAVSTAQRLREIPILKASTIATLAQAQANRLLTLTIPVIGIALAGVTTALIAYDQNWGNFQDTMKETFPFLKDQKDLFEQTKGTLDSGRTALQGFNNELGVTKSRLENTNPLLREMVSNLIAMGGESNRVAAAQLTRAAQLTGGVAGGPSNGPVGANPNPSGLKLPPNFARFLLPTLLTAQAAKTKGSRAPEPNRPPTTFGEQFGIPFIIPLPTHATMSFDTGVGAPRKFADRVDDFSSFLFTDSDKNIVNAIGFPTPIISHKVSLGSGGTGPQYRFNKAFQTLSTESQLNILAQLILQGGVFVGNNFVEFSKQPKLGDIVGQEFDKLVQKAKPDSPLKAFKDIQVKGTSFVRNPRLFRDAFEAIAPEAGSTVLSSKGVVPKAITDSRVSKFLVNAQSKPGVHLTDFTIAARKAKSEAVSEFMGQFNNFSNGRFFAGFGGGLLTAPFLNGPGASFGHGSSMNLKRSILGLAPSRAVELLSKLQAVDFAINGPKVRNKGFGVSHSKMAELLEMGVLLGGSTFDSINAETSRRNESFMTELEVRGFNNFTRPLFSTVGNTGITKFATFGGSGFFKSSGATAAAQMVGRPGVHRFLGNRRALNNSLNKALSRSGFSLGLESRIAQQVSIARILGIDAQPFTAGSDLLERYRDIVTASGSFDNLNPTREFTNLRIQAIAIFNQNRNRRIQKINELFSQYGGPLELNRGQIESIAINASRTVNELEDRLLFKERLVAISTGNGGF